MLIYAMALLIKLAIVGLIIFVAVHVNLWFLLLLAVWYHIFGPDYEPKKKRTVKRRRKKLNKQ